MEDGILGLNLQGLQVARVENHGLSMSQLDGVAFLAGLGHGKTEGEEQLDDDVDDNVDDDDEDDDDLETGLLNDQEKITQKEYLKGIADRRKLAKAATSLPERNGPEWERVMRCFASRKVYMEAIDDYALWLDERPAMQGILLERAAEQYFDWKYTQVNYLGEKCNRGSSMRSIQSYFVKYWKFVYYSDFKMLCPVVSDLCSQWEKVQPPVKKTQVLSLFPHQHSLQLCDTFYMTGIVMITTPFCRSSLEGKLNVRTQCPSLTGRCSHF